MTTDQKIQFILEQIQSFTTFNGKEFYIQNWGKDSINEFFEIEKKMVHHHLIKVDKKTSNYTLTILGKRVLENGGWIKFNDDRAKTFQTQEVQQAEYEAMKSRNLAEKEHNLSQENYSTASSKSPTASEGMKFSNVIFLIAFLLGIAFLIWIIWG